MIYSLTRFVEVYPDPVITWNAQLELTQNPEFDESKSFFLIIFCNNKFLFFIQPTNIQKLNIHELYQKIQPINKIFAHCLIRIRRRFMVLEFYPKIVLVFVSENVEIVVISASFNSHSFDWSTEQSFSDLVQGRSDHRKM